MDIKILQIVGKCFVMYGGNIIFGKFVMKWWFNVFNLDILYQYDVCINLMDIDFSYWDYVKIFDFEVVKKDVYVLMMDS